jgi:hypothetical protein
LSCRVFALSTPYPALPARSPPEPLVPGDRVRLHSLDTAAHNNKLGVLEKLIAASGRWEVKLDSAHSLAVRPQNLARVTAGTAAPGLQAGGRIKETCPTAQSVRREEAQEEYTDEEGWEDDVESDESDENSEEYTDEEEDGDEESNGSEQEEDDNIVRNSEGDSEEGGSEDSVDAQLEATVQLSREHAGIGTSETAALRMLRIRLTGFGFRVEGLGFGV